MIEPMWDNHDAQLIIDVMKKLDLSPLEIKDIITHGHGDHYGAAQFIKDNYKAKIAMSQTDYNLMNTVNSGANGPQSAKCSVDNYDKRLAKNRIR